MRWAGADFGLPNGQVHLALYSLDAFIGPPPDWRPACRSSPTSRKRSIEVADWRRPRTHSLLSK